MSEVKGQSLLSNISNLNYNQQYGKLLYSGSGFFKDSLPGAFTQTSKDKPIFKQEIGIDSLKMNSNTGSNSEKQTNGVYISCWTNDDKNMAEGISDEEFEHFEYPSRGLKREKSIQERQDKVNRDTTEKEKGQRKRKGKNETKNIPKNFGKAIIIFIEKNKKLVKPILQEEGLNYKMFLEEIQEKKKSINTIAQLRDMWTDFRYAKVMRVLSARFFRKHSYEYIFNSRIKSQVCHLKYKKRIQQALNDPISFSHIKDY